MPFCVFAHGCMCLAYQNMFQEGRLWIEFFGYLSNRSSIQTVLVGPSVHLPFVWVSEINSLKYPSHGVDDCAWTSRFEVFWADSKHTGATRGPVNLDELETNKWLAVGALLGLPVFVFRT